MLGVFCLVISLFLRNALLVGPVNAEVIARSPPAAITTAARSAIATARRVAGFLPTRGDAAAGASAGAVRPAGAAAGMAVVAPAVIASMPSVSGAPQLVQNSAPSSFSAPHSVQYIGIPFRALSGFLHHVPRSPRRVAQHFARPAPLCKKSGFRWPECKENGTCWSRETQQVPLFLQMGQRKPFSLQEAQQVPNSLHEAQGRRAGLPGASPLTARSRGRGRRGGRPRPRRRRRRLARSSCPRPRRGRSCARRRRGRARPAAA